MGRTSGSGFTLIELMIVVVIIGILAAIAIPKFNDVTESTQRNACRANMRTIASQEVIYLAVNGVYADAMADLGLTGVECPAAQLPYVPTPVKDSSSPVQRFQPSRRCYDSRIDSWISLCFLNEFHCFSDSVG